VHYGSVAEGPDAVVLVLIFQSPLAQAGRLGLHGEWVLEHSKVRTVPISPVVHDLPLPAQPAALAERGARSDALEAAQMLILEAEADGSRTAQQMRRNFVFWLLLFVCFSLVSLFGFCFVFVRLFLLT
jgi:hypothetical protein